MYKCGPQKEEETKVLEADSKLKVEMKLEETRVASESKGKVMVEKETETDLDEMNKLKVSEGQMEVVSEAHTDREVEDSIKDVANSEVE